MTETIDSANAAASTLFLGQNGEFWDFWLIMSVVLAALSAVAIGITTTGSIVSHKREAAGAEEALARYKLETGEKITESTARAAEANAAAKQAELALQKLRMPRMLDSKKFAEQLVGSKPAETVQILYVEGCADCFELADMIGTLLTEAHWPSSVAILKPPPNPPDWLADLPTTWQNRANSTGISVLTLSPMPDIKAKEPGAAIVRAIAVCEVGNLMISNDPDLAPGVVKVVVAPKI